ncbi:hypothetical protein KI387_033878, partial [Taxus chinensis]
WDQKLHVPLDIFENDEAFAEFMGLKDSILAGDHKKGFKIQLNTYAYFREEVEMCGRLSNNMVKKSKNTSEKPGKNDKRKSHSDKLFDTLIYQQNEEHMDKIVYPFKDDNEIL